MFSNVLAYLDPVVASGIPNLASYIQHLKEDYGVEISNSSGPVCVKGTLIQVQCVQQHWR